MQIQCSQCQSPLSPGARFCAQCGKQFEQPVPESAVGVAPSAPAKKHNPLALGCLGLLGLVVVLGIIGNLAGERSPTTEQAVSSEEIAAPPAEAPPAPASKVTLANYNRLKTGMSYAEVSAILGEGTEMSRSEIADYVTVMYSWDGDGFGANMNAMFQNGKLVQKAQFGLK